VLRLNLPHVKAAPCHVLRLNLATARNDAPTAAMVAFQQTTTTCNLEQGCEQTGGLCARVAALLMQRDTAENEMQPRARRRRQPEAAECVLRYVASFVGGKTNCPATTRKYPATTRQLRESLANPRPTCRANLLYQLARRKSSSETRACAGEHVVWSVRDTRT
jgi:hypothetical protein